MAETTTELESALSVTDSGDSGTTVNVTINDTLSISESHLPSISQSLASTVKPSALSHFLSHLVFEGHVMRFTLELLIVFNLYTVLNFVAPITPIAPKWHALTAWMISCITVAIIDHLLLVPPLFIYRRACILDAAAESKKALELLESISPYQDRLVRFPKHLYHLARFNFLRHSGEFATAERELEIARILGVSRSDYDVYRLAVLRERKDYASAIREIEKLREGLGDSALLAIENGFVHLDERKDLRAARKFFDRALELPDLSHPVGATAHALGKAFREVCRLWTGYAEEAIDALSLEIDRLSGVCAGVESMRPILSQLYLERALYFATHKEQLRAESDLRVGQVLCNHPAHAVLAERVAGELEWRFRENR